ncbi:S-formylglutathione hydrolase [Sphingomonas immobilis]|uniref:S-formylglutathione hydrolase n=1 Tax=Sphingomonas immobilis TaxID=3063997 RepID=A0ABT9A097_9SPHN|nr:S-formylglutathione hydrolase [Sphingomonas sp. CA1-15]MDO7843248.1 S-formylglutathione hydrolase [Sphingomonas sp. CA1-15]
MIETVSRWKSHGGVQGVYRHASSTTASRMTFSVFVPPLAPGAIAPVVWYLSGLTCTHANATEKAEYRRTCAELGLIFVVCDTSPRGEGVPGDPNGAFDFGFGAGFYLDATEAPWSANYRMWSYVTGELPDVIAANFPADMARQSIMGHSMGGHGALTIALTLPDRFKAVSAFAPIAAPSQVPFGRKALRGYLGDDEAAWRAHDSVALIEDGKRFGTQVLVDQGDADEFLDENLKAPLLAEACKAAGIDLTLRMQPGYDHSYYFISTFMADHLRWHAERLR